MFLKAASCPRCNMLCKKCLRHLMASFNWRHNARFAEADLAAMCLALESAASLFLYGSSSKQDTKPVMS